MTRRGDGRSEFEFRMKDFVSRAIVGMAAVIVLCTPLLASATNSEIEALVADHLERELRQ